MRRLVALCTIVLGASACTEREPDAAAATIPSVALPADLDRVLRDYEAAYARRDADGLSALFAEDGMLLAPGQPPVRGRAALAAAFAGEGGALALVPLASGRSDSVAWIVGTFGAARSARAGGKFVLALRRRGGEPWRIAADIANPNGR
ncbi:MAG TPA: DUF4440 domain-containing protein [Gemmatimonadaceae bacterium]|nr:DUF4440 domain-containing protein [Gemmatimonadaceae bacterium]